MRLKYARPTAPTASRSDHMSRIRGKNTFPERIVRSSLHKMGYRYRLHTKDLPGKPDLVFKSRRKVIFVHGCFWHGHDCARGISSTRSLSSTWGEKIQTNRTRDGHAQNRLTAMGWGVLQLWECELGDDEWIAKAVDFLNN